MEIYFAAGLSKDDVNYFKQKHRILSYYMDGRSLELSYLKEGMFLNNPDIGDIQIFLDSGAFSAFTKGVDVDIYEYIDYIKRHKDHLHLYANLDVIGDSAATWKNQKIMERAGLSPLPCFHYGEHTKWLKKYIRNYEYIALGGMVPIQSQQLQMWLDDLFENYICGKDGLPRVKVHGFGMTTQSLILRYPWYSIDSTSWAIAGGIGDIMVPVVTWGIYDFQKQPLLVNVSNRPGSVNTTTKGKHFEHCSEKVKEYVLQYINSLGYVMGKSIFRKVKQTHKLKINEAWAEPKSDVSRRLLEIKKEIGISNSHQIRKLVNIHFYNQLGESCPKWPWAYKPKRKAKFNI